MNSRRRTYEQYCGLAAALDIVGERWTLLIVRELLPGPMRYGELMNNLPRMGTNLLADRLKFLVDAGVVRKTTDGGSAKRPAYELTESGRELRPVVLSLARWGLEHLGDLTPDLEVRATWGILAVEAMIDPAHAGVAEQYEFRVDDEVFHIDVTEHDARAVAGPATTPSIVVDTDAATFVQIGAGVVSPLAAIVTGKVKFDGDNDALLRACELLGLEVPVPATA